MGDISEIKIDRKNKCVCIEIISDAPDENYGNIDFDEWLKIAKEIDIKSTIEYDHEADHGQNIQGD